MTDQQLIDGYLNQSLDAEAFDDLQERLLSSAVLRADLRRQLALVDHLEQLSSSDGDVELLRPWQQTPPEPLPMKNTLWAKLPWLVAAIAVLVAGAVLINDRSGSATDEVALHADSASEPSAEGFAVVRQVRDAVLADDGSLDTDSMLTSETLKLVSGSVELQFFSGAEMTLQGPAELEILSAWEAVCRRGSVRVKVPEAAQGFRLRGPETEIVDLGTEFGLEVGAEGAARVEVFDGEIAVHHRQEAERLITTGDAWELPSDGAATQIEPGIAQIPSPVEPTHSSRYADWRAYRDALTDDERLIAYYTFAEKDGAIVDHRDQHHGAKIRAESVASRWGGDEESAVEFRRPGSRVRVSLPGEFSAFTFMCWVRIDSLDRWYNALFMGDGYETGEPHWQIRDDGRLMLSVMVDDSQPHPKNPTDAGLHRVYFSPPFWDPSMSGQWIHLCSTYDPAQRQVCHYVDGELIHQAEIVDQFYIERLRIGNAELGNWGQPFRTNPLFAMRNLNGRMDELAVFSSALSPQEVQEHYQQSRH